MIADLQGADFDVSLTGFDPAELDDLFKESIKDGIHDDDFDVDAELKEPPITKLGDVWTLGRHRLVCGDSTKTDTFDLLMAGAKATLRFRFYDDREVTTTWESTAKTDWWTPERRRLWGERHKRKDTNPNKSTYYEFTGFIKCSCCGSNYAFCSQNLHKIILCSMKLGVAFIRNILAFVFL